MSNQRKTDDTIKILLIVLAIIVLGPMLMMFAFPLIGMWGSGMMGGYRGFSLWGLGMMLVWLVILVGGGYLVYRWLAGTGSIASDRALEELRVAYARGDISEEEFEQRRSKLEGDWRTK